MILEERMAYIKLVAAVIVIFLGALACSSKDISSAAKNNQKIEVAKNKQLYKDFNSEKIISSIDDDTFLEEIDSIIDDNILPEPEIELHLPYINITQNGNEFYEEFKEFNVPMAMTSRVSAYINYFTKRVPKTTQSWLNRSNKYMNIVQDIFVKEGLPSDLVVLAFTESGFNTHAVSHAGAVGMWQFIKSTGKLYGMEQNFWVDERRDFEKATYAAAKYLKDLYNRFGDWYLALAAYNAGPGRVARATKKHNTKDFFTISKSRYTWKLETRDYVPKFLAQLIIYKNYLKYDFSPPSDMPLLFAKVEVESQTNLYMLAEKLDIDVKNLIELNPALKVGMTPPGKYTIRVPYGKGEEAQKILSNLTAAERAMYNIYNAKQGEKLQKIASKTGVTVAEIKKVNGLRYDTVFAPRPLFIPIKNISTEKINNEFASMLLDLAPKYYKVRRGDTFIEIAHRHGMRMGDLQRLNPNIRASRIYPGQHLVVSEGATSGKRIVAKVAVKKKKPSLTNGKYKVKRGDSLWSIARKFGTSVDKITSKNNITTNDVLRPGKVLVIR